MRKRKTPLSLYVYVHPDEKVCIERLAAQVGLSTSAYLRRLGLGYAPKTVIDVSQVREMIHCRADLGRLGGLLKGWLSGEFERGLMDMEFGVRGLLREIEESQRKLRKIINNV